MKLYIFSNGRQSEVDTKYQMASSSRFHLLQAVVNVPKGCTVHLNLCFVDSSVPLYNQVNSWGAKVAHMTDKKRKLG
jgi:hypothetical protein